MSDHARDVVKKSVGGAAITTLAGLLGRAAGLLTTIVVTHFLSRDEYGNSNLAMIIAAVLNMVTLLSPQQVLLTRHERFDLATSLVRFYAAASGLIFGVLLFLFGRPVVGLLGQPEAAPLLQIYSLALMLDRLGVIPALWLNYELRFRKLAQLEAAGNLAYVAVTISTAALGLGGASLAWGQVARCGLRLAFLVMVLGARVWPSVPAWTAEVRQVAREVLHAAWPLHLGGCGEFMTLYLDNVLIGKLYGASAQGLYVVAYTLVMTPTDTIALYGATAMVRALGVRDDATRRHTYLMGLRYLAALLFPLGVGATLLAGTLERALLPARWHGLSPIVLGLSGGAMTMGIMRLSFVHLTAIGRSRAAALVEVLRLGLFVLCLSLAALFDPSRAHLSFIGWGVSAAFVLSALAGFCLSLRADALPFRDGIAALVPPLAASIFMGGILIAAQALFGALLVAPSAARLIMELSLGVLAYAGYLRVFHGAMYREASRFFLDRLRASPSAK